MCILRNPDVRTPIVLGHSIGSAAYRLQYAVRPYSDSRFKVRIIQGERLVVRRCEYS